MARTPKQEYEIIYHNITELVDDIRNKHTREALREIAQTILDKSQEPGYVPVDTGALKASGKITKEIEGSGKGIKKYEVAVEYGGVTKKPTKATGNTDIVDYAGYVENNQQFLARAFEASQADIKKILAEMPKEVEQQAKSKKR